jgi:Kef-type K+ transport system membrane component KefB
MSFPPDPVFAFLLSGGADAARLPLSLLLVFGSAKIMAELFERLRQPAIIGEILAGVLIGPSVLGWIEPELLLNAFSQLGVMFLLFRIGLEVKASELMRVGGTAAAVGVLGVVVPLLSGWGVFLYWGRPEMEAIFVGAALTATSVGITAQVLSDKGVLDRLASKIILAAAVIDDVLALLVLGVVSGVARGTVNVIELVLTSIGAVVFVLLVARWGKKTVGAVMPRLEARIRVEEGHFALAMVFLFGMAALSVQAGVAPIIGAFLAGMAMGDHVSRRTHELTHGITEFLVPFFLVGIGLHFDVAAFANSPTIVLALVVVFVAIFSKVIGCGLGAARYGVTVASRVGLGMIPRGEFCMIVAQIGLGLKVIPADTYAIVVFMAVSVTMLAPPLLHLAFRGAVRPGAEVEERLRIH